MSGIILMTIQELLACASKLSAAEWFLYTVQVFCVPISMGFVWALNALDDYRARRKAKG